MIATQSYREHYTYLWHDKGERYIEQHYNYQAFFNELNDPNITSWIISSHDKSVGIIKVNISKAVSRYSAKESMELERIYLIKDASGKGYGKAVLNFVVEFAISHNKTLLWIKAMNQINPVDFYKKSGFKIIGQNTLDLPFIIEKHKGMVIMIKRL